MRLEDFLTVAFSLVGIVFVFVGIFAIAVYVMESLSLYTIAKRRGIHKPWLAWIPVGSEWIIGCISDQYQYVVKGKTRSLRKVLLILGIVVLIIAAVLAASCFDMLGTIFSNLERLDNMTDEQVFELILTPALSALGISLITAILTIAMAVIEYIAIYDIYRSCSPENATAFIILSIFFSITLPIFLLICRNKDGGMPPRQDAPRPAPRSPDRGDPWNSNPQ